MSKKVFGFQKQLKQGEKGEKFFIKCYKELKSKKSDIREVDIFINGNETVELKTDSYSEEKTQNFFIELVGSTVSGKLGGVHLSHQDNIDYFVYHYTPEKSFYWFRPSELVRFIDENGHRFQKREIKSVSWSSIGLLVPRSEVEHLLIRKDIF